MLPSVIEKLEDALEGDRQHYSQSTEVGSKNYLKFVLQLDGKHPVQVKNNELLSEATKFADTKTRLEAKAIPDGKIAADPNVVELGEAVVGLGLKSKREISDLKNRAETAETKLNEENEAKLNARVANAAGKNSDAWKEHVTAKGLKFEETTVKDEKDNDVTQTTVIHKDANGNEVRTALKDYTEKNAAHVAAAKPEKRRSNNFNFPKEDEPEGETNEFDQMEKEAAARNKAKTANTASFTDMFFGRTQGING